MIKYELKLNELKERQIKVRRQNELLEWARSDYGIDMTSTTKRHLGGFSGSKTKNFYNTTSRFTIEDETDFIHKVRNRYHRKVNNQAATRI